MRKVSTFLFVMFLLTLSACSLGVDKKSDKSGTNIEETENLSEDRKVRDIELFITNADYDPIRYEFGLLIAEEWRKLGLDVDATALAWNRLSEVAETQKEFDAFTLTWGGTSDRIDPEVFLYSLHSSAQGIGGYNFPGFENERFDQLVEKQREVTDEDERKVLVDEAQEIFSEEVPLGTIVYRDQLKAYNNKNFENLDYMMGEGLNSFWTFLNATPTGDRETLRWGYPSDIKTINPLTAAGTHEIQLTRLIYDRLVRVTEDGPKNWAAESVKDLNEDGKSFEVKLRDGMKFHDGEPVTAEDVKFSYDIVKEVESPYFIGMIEPIKNIEIKDELTIVFELNKSYAPFIGNTLGQMFIFPKHYWEPILKSEGPSGVTEHQNNEVIGSGPFKFDYWKKDQEISLVRNEDYFQKPKVDGVLHVAYASIQGMVDALGNGEIDTVGQWIEETQAEKLSENENLEVISVPNHGYYHINYNLRRMPFDDKAMRQALTYMIPKERILEEILQGHGVIANSFIAPVNEVWHNPDIKKYDYNPEKAIQILKDAGYEWDEDGKIYYPEGKSDKNKEKGVIRNVE